MTWAWILQHMQGQTSKLVCNLHIKIESTKKISGWTFVLPVQKQMIRIYLTWACAAEAMPSLQTAPSLSTAASHAHAWGPSPRGTHQLEGLMNCCLPRQKQQLVILDQSAVTLPQQQAWLGATTVLSRSLLETWRCIHHIPCINNSCRAGTTTLQKCVTCSWNNAIYILLTIYDRQLRELRFGTQHQGTMLEHICATGDVFLLEKSSKMNMASYFLFEIHEWCLVCSNSIIADVQRSCNIVKQEFIWLSEQAYQHNKHALIDLTYLYMIQGLNYACCYGMFLIGDFVCPNSRPPGYFLVIRKDDPGELRSSIFSTPS